MASTLAASDLPDLARGAAFLGTGGGGDPYIGRLMVERAIAAGAYQDSVKIVDVEDVPLAYLPGNATRIRVKAVGDLVMD